MSEESEVKEEDEVILGTAGAVVIFASVEESEAHMALFEGIAGTRKEGAPVLDVDGRGVKAAAPLLVDLVKNWNMWQRTW
jgi:hypothetical protein